MQTQLKPADRLIVAADFKPTPEGGKALVRRHVLGLADKLQGTGVYLKVNSALRACGYDLIDEIHARGLRVFADLKLIDIGETLATDGLLLREAQPDILTVMCGAGIVAMQMLDAELPDTEVLGVTVLTSLKDSDMEIMYGCKTVKEQVMRFAHTAAAAEIDGLIASPAEAAMLRDRFGDLFTINTPAIRPTWSIIQGDDQNAQRVMTPFMAIQSGADRIVVGRPITKSESPMKAVIDTLGEIGEATDALAEANSN